MLNSSKQSSTNSKTLENSSIAVTFLFFSSFKVCIKILYLFAFITIRLQSIASVGTKIKSQGFISKLFVYNYFYLNTHSRWQEIHFSLLPGSKHCLFLKIFITQDKIRNCPVLTPNENQFKDFFKFVTEAENKYRNQYGMVRVVPPKNWKPNSKQIKRNIDDLLVNGPIQQNIFGKGGVYEAILIQKKSMTLKQYKQKVCPFDKMTQGLSNQQIQSKFWKNICFSPPLYGADILNSLMDQKAGAWNLNNLESVVKYSMDNKCKGVNTPYVYIGSWKTFFAWHKEDLDLSAINYLHEGKSKFWYSIAPNQSHLLQKVAKRHFPEHFAKCSQHLRHKTSLINPYLLKQQCPQINICKTQHKKNEFILVFGGAYHTGFNSGFNVAQAVNYATPNWLQEVTSVKYCKCQKSSVKANLFELRNNLQKSPIAKTDEFKHFAQKIYDLQSKQTQQQLKSQQIKAVKSVFSKKIKKNPKQNISKISYRGQQYEVQNWAQCQKCKIWRKTKRQVKQNEKFLCKSINRNCNQKQKIGKDYITL